MTYTTPVYDRTQADITAQNSKAYLNVADWIRIYDNAEWVNDLFLSAIGIDINFDTQADPTTSTVPDKTDWLNLLTGNIEVMRLWAYHYLGSYIFPDSLFVEIKDDWLDGYENNAPNFSHANSWEYVLDVLYNILNTWTPPTVTGNIEFVSGGDIELVGGGNLEFVG